MRDFFTEEVANIREMICQDPSYSQLSDEQLKDRAEKMLDERMRQVGLSDPELASYYSSLSFRTKKSLADSVYESIRGLGILGKIISDKSITEVMINGYDTIFVERDGKLTQIPDKFESKESLRNIITRFVQDILNSVPECPGKQVRTL